MQEEHFSAKRFHDVFCTFFSCARFGSLNDFALNSVDLCRKCTGKVRRRACRIRKYAKWMCHLPTGTSSPIVRRLIYGKLKIIYPNAKPKPRGLFRNSVDNFLEQLRAESARYWNNQNTISWHIEQKPSIFEKRNRNCRNSKSRSIDRSERSITRRKLSKI